MAKDPEQLAHQEWLGYVQPVGLVVSIPALLAAQAHVNCNIAPDHTRFLACLPRNADDETIAELPNLADFTENVLNWRKSDLEAVVAGDARYAALEVHLPEYQETLRPDFVVRDPEPKSPDHPWMMLIQTLPAGTAFDRLSTTEETHWQATPESKFERLLRETRVPVGLLASPSHLRLVYAPRGESSGHMTFGVAEMAQVAGRPIFAALHMLLCDERLFSMGEKQRLPAILADSRKYQNHVSNELAQQVLAALYELLRGFQAADDATRGELLREVLAADPNHVYSGLLTVLMRLVFVLYAEDRDLISSDPVYANHYSVTGLFQRLRADAGRHPDTMDQRFGAWAQLLTLFRLVYEGGRHGALKIPPRKGYLFDPDRYNFLEGRPWRVARAKQQSPPTVPRVSDGVIYRVLTNLLILDGERLSYRTLDVEQIGSVYETIMGFNLQVAQGRSIAIKPKRAHGAPATINLEELLAVKPADRSKWLKNVADQDVPGQALTALKEAKTIDDLLAALERKIARSVSPNVVPNGSMVFQPSDERRRSGSHYTPRSLTEPIVRKTLEPILVRLGEKPTPEQILALKVCDPAMGSGAFLVEACRQLGDELVKAWHLHQKTPRIPPDEDEVLHARRLVAQRCLYGVDKNPLAVDLAKLSLWLATLAKDHPFTFLDHCLKHGDSLVGLSREQIVDLDWREQADVPLMVQKLDDRLATATAFRARILAARDDFPYEQLQQQLAQADEALVLPRLAGDAVIAAFFAGANDKQRRAALSDYQHSLIEWLSKMDRQEREALGVRIDALKTGERPVVPFHWHIEFPEVFTVDDKHRLTGGFDAVVGNPPFAGKNTLINGNREGYVDWLKNIHEQSHGNADLIAHFFRRAFHLLRAEGCFGLIATNTIGQGDTRSTGLRWVCTHGGTIYAARRRVKWPGSAAVVVSVVHVCRGKVIGPCVLDGRFSPIITAYLFHAGGNEDPAPLKANAGKSFQGSIVLGMGFTFDDSSKDGTANPLSLMQELIKKNPRNAERIVPYIGGEEVNDSPTHTHHRYVINFGELPENECRRKWPGLMRIVEEKVKPERLLQKDAGAKSKWWQFIRPRGGLQAAARNLERVIVCCRHQPNWAITFTPVSRVFAESLIVVTLHTYSAFTVLSSCVHEAWARFLGSSMKDDLRYTPTDCFETYPFPHSFESNYGLAVTGQEYYEFRSALMVTTHEGLTKTYNRFHDPYETSADIVKLRELHAAMDKAVLEAYGWNDLATTARCEFLLDYEEEDDEEEAGSRGRTRKKPWRYRWPDEFRDEVLARLLELNRLRAEDERKAALTDAGASKTGKKAPKSARPPAGVRRGRKPKTDVDSTQGEMF